MDNKNLEKQTKKISYWNGAVHYNFSENGQLCKQLIIFLATENKQQLIISSGLHEQFIGNIHL